MFSLYYLPEKKDIQRPNKRIIQIVTRSVLDVSFCISTFAVSERCYVIIILIVMISKHEECEKKSSSISTKDTVVNLYTRNSHFCMAVLKLRRKMYFAFWYFDALVCFIMFCFLYGHQLYFRQKIDHVQTRDNQGIATYIFTISVSFCISISLQRPVIKARVSMRYFMCLYL